jgi:hypothetical protein
MMGSPVYYEWYYAPGPAVNADRKAHVAAAWNVRS